MSRQLTGRHVLIIAVACFGLVIAANLAMLFAATGSFPGLVVENSYAAGRGWDQRAADQAALGWKTDITYSRGAIELALTDREGNPVRNADLSLTVGRPTHEKDDRTLEAVITPDGYRFETELAPGAWRLDLKTVSGPAFQTTAELLVPEKP